MIEKPYDCSTNGTKQLEELIDDCTLEFFVVKSPNPRNYTEVSK